MSEHNEAEALTRKIAEALHHDRWDRDTLETILPILSDALEKKDEEHANAFDAQQTLIERLKNLLATRRTYARDNAALQADLATARAEVEESETRRAETVAMVTHLRADLAAKEADIDSWRAEARFYGKRAGDFADRMDAAEARVREAGGLLRRWTTETDYTLTFETNTFLAQQPAEKPTACEECGSSNPTIRGGALYNDVAYPCNNAWHDTPPSVTPEKRAHDYCCGAFVIGNCPNHPPDPPAAPPVFSDPDRKG